MEKRVCPNCGAELVWQDDKFMCPMCGTEFAIDWGKDDVSRAEAMTAEERKAARFERNYKLNEAKEEIKKQEKYNAYRRSSSSRMNGLKKFGIIIGLALIGYTVFNFGIKLLLAGGIQKVAQIEEVTGTQKVSEVTVDNLRQDEFLMENSIETGYYYIKYEALNSTWSKDLDSIVTRSNDGKFVEAYLFEEYEDPRICLFYEVEFRTETGEVTTIYEPVVLTNVFGVNDGVFHINYNPGGISLAEDDLIMSEDLDGQVEKLCSEYKGEKIDVPSDVIAKVEEGRA